jgi:transposase
MIKAHKIRLNPTAEQANYFVRAAGTARFVWNWALAEWNRQAEAGEKPTALKLKKQFNDLRRKQFPWTWEVTKNASDQPLFDLGKAWTAFFEGRKNGKKTGRPKFKSKKKSQASFYLANDQMELGDHRVWIPKLGWVNTAENLRFKGKVTGARITKTAAWWFISISVELPDEHPDRCTPAVGIDVGLNRLATLSTGEGYENQAFLKTALKKLRQASKVEQGSGVVIKINRFFPSTKSCHCCGWKWAEMKLSDRIFLCQNPTCAYYQFPQDRDHNGGLNILYEALRLIGLLDQVVTGTGSDEDVNLAADAG